MQKSCMQASEDALNNFILVMFNEKVFILPFNTRSCELVQNAVMTPVALGNS